MDTGIAEGDLAHIFDRFWQASKTKGRGAGLGLAIVKGIVEAHGGRVCVTSAPGNGSRFRFTIPRAETDTNREMEHRRSTSPTIGLKGCRDRGARCLMSY